MPCNTGIRQVFVVASSREAARRPQKAATARPCPPAATSARPGGRSARSRAVPPTGTLKIAVPSRLGRPRRPEARHGGRAAQSDGGATAGAAHDADRARGRAAALCAEPGEPMTLQFEHLRLGSFANRLNSLNVRPRRRRSLRRARAGRRRRPSAAPPRHRLPRMQGHQAAPAGRWEACRPRWVCISESMWMMAEEEWTWRGKLLALTKGQAFKRAAPTSGDPPAARRPAFAFSSARRAATPPPRPHRA